MDNRRAFLLGLCSAPLAALPALPARSKEVSTLVLNLEGPALDAIKRLDWTVRALNANIETRAVQAVKDAMARNV
jgi:hypothetical protein